MEREKYDNSEVSKLSVRVTLIEGSDWCQHDSRIRRCKTIQKPERSSEGSGDIRPMIRFPTYLETVSWKSCITILRVRLDLLFAVEVVIFS